MKVKVRVIVLSVLVVASTIWLAVNIASTEKSPLETMTVTEVKMLVRDWNNREEPKTAKAFHKIFGEPCLKQQSNGEYLLYYDYKGELVIRVDTERYDLGSDIFVDPNIHLF